MTPLPSIVRDKFLIWGWITILFSASLFCIPTFAAKSSENYLAFFVLHFGLAITYHFILAFNKGTRVANHMIHYRTIKLVLLLISAYALNREMDVFAASPEWFSTILVVLCIAYLASVAFQQLPWWGRFLLLFLYGVGLIVFGYLAIYLLPLYPISVPGLLLLGISLHTFVPVLFCLLTIFLLQRLAQSERRYWTGVAAGIVVTVVVCIGFVVSWNNKLHHMNRQYTSAMAEGEDKLPLWVQVAQSVERDAFTEKILKTGLIYKIPQWTDVFGWNLPGRNFGEQQQLHDPLVTLATAFSGAVLLPEDDRIKVLESQYNARHQALERLWSGEALKTEQLTTTVKVWPHLRMAYTEKLLTVYNHQSTQRWISQGEAIYTFHMPEGAVVTSLSLWINGKEEKGILTSKQAATTAYRTIVGYERRDPSVVHWQEGNTVSVRVFPVMAGSSRTFKIGITAPLRKDGAEVVYDNIWFDGTRCQQRR
jgi:XrtN system VIT domain protein